MIRRAKLEELKDVVELVRVLWKEGLSTFPFPYDLETVQRTILSFFMDYRTSRIFVAYDDGKLVGTLIGTLRPGVFSLFQTIGQIRLWYIRPAARGKGIGVWMFREFVKWCRECKASTIVTSNVHAVDSLAAPHVFDKLGFRPFETAYVMSLED